MATGTQTTPRARDGRSWTPWGIDDADVRIFLVAAMVVSAALGLWFSRDTTFSLDEIEVFSGTAHLDLQGALEPSSSGHLFLTWRLTFAALLNAFGADYLPFRVLAMGTVLLTAGLFFVFVKRRVGSVVALAPTLVLLFYGSDTLHAISGNGFIVLLGLAAGIAALLALEREDRAGDVAACALLILAVSTFSSAIAFVVGVAVLIVIGSDRWRRAWVFLVPAVLYAAWVLWSRKFDTSAESTVTLSNLLLAPDWALNGLSTAGAALLGLNYPFSGTANQGWGPVVAVIAVAALGWRLSRGDISRWLWALIAIPVTLWVTEAARGPLPGFRGPDSARYIFPATIAILLVAAEAARGARFGRRVTIAIYVVAAISLATNIALLRDGSAGLRAQAPTTRADLSAVEIGNGRLAAPFSDTILGAVLRQTGEGSVATGYLDSVRDFGSPAFSLSALQAQSEPLRAHVDSVLADNLDVALEPVHGPPRNCERVSDRHDQGATFRLPPGGAVLRASGSSAPADLRLRRFGTAFSVPAGELQSGEASALSIPRDSAPVPWVASTSAAQLEVCGPPT